MVTSDIFIDTLATIEAKGVAKAVQKAQKEEKAALHVMWEASKQKWQRKRESLKSHGLKMELAGPKPQLKDMKLPGAKTHATIGSDASYFTNCRNTTFYSLKDIARLSWGRFFDLGLIAIRLRV